MPDLRAGWALGALLLGLAVFTAAPTCAQPTPPTTVVVIADINQILHNAKSAKDVQAQIDKAMTEFSHQVSTSENELQQMRDTLERERNTLSPDAYSTKTRQYQQRFDALDRAVQARRQALQQSYNDAMTMIENTALQIIAQIAGERKANMVLTRAAVLFAANDLDITAEVTKRLDAKLPTMSVKLPPPVAPPPAAPLPAKH
ncbi:MAG: OmpH family outer membrane protein [Alphaproteobacteria bacterium]|nr:OmpH family outer membrane protein [Alphaproteobacteria bacterium]